MAIPPEDIQKVFEYPGSPAIQNELWRQLLYQTVVPSVELATFDPGILTSGSEKSASRRRKPVQIKPWLRGNHLHIVGN